ncbi:MAG TPA: bifunctional diaminohydroxyphosphoribosylaminopyrimidine deaminase/5-amino-6-(5-phosphoribosylamino)uracil reductase RibD, partial [Pontiella sp.]
ENIQLPASGFRQSTLYVTLEPCSTHGRTPPCTDLILEKGIGRVVVSVVDRNPDHAGRGLEILRQAGVEVITGVCETEGEDLIAPFNRFITAGRPYVTLKLALTLDGRIADSEGHSKWITGTEARERVQEMRRRADAIMVGAGTIRADDPSLLPRPAEGRKPYRVVIGTDIPEGSAVLTDEAAERTLILKVEGRPPCRPRTGQSPSLQIASLAEGLRILADQYDIMHVLCEGGGQLAAGLVKEGLVDEFVFFIAPKLMGADGLPGFGKTGGLMDDVDHLRFETVERIGADLLIKAKPGS